MSLYEANAARVSIAKKKLPEDEEVTTGLRRLERLEGALAIGLLQLALGLWQLQDDEHRL